MDEATSGGRVNISGDHVQLHAMSQPALRRLTAALLTLAAALGLTLASSPPAHAAGESYVALGDSYSSGVGTRSYIDDGTSCQRSTLAYPSLLAAQRGYALDFRACSGATVADVTNSQLGALNSGTSFVTISVGGNDAGFADVLTECALPGWASDCDGAIDGAQADHQQLPARQPERALRVDQRSRAVGRRWSWSATRGSSWARTATRSPSSPRRRSRGSTPPPTCSTACSRRSRPRTASASPTRPAPSPATRSATTRSGSTASPTRSATATTPTSPATRRATRRWWAGCSASRSRRPRRSCRRPAPRAPSWPRSSVSTPRLDRAIEPELFQAPDLHSPQRPQGREGARDQPGALDRRPAHLTASQASSSRVRARVACSRCAHAMGRRPVQRSA